MEKGKVKESAKTKAKTPSKADSTERQPGGAVFTAPLLTLVIYILLTFSRFLDLEALKYRDNVYLSIIILQLIIFMLPALFFCKLKGTGYSLRLNLRLFAPTRIWFLVLSALTLLTGTAVIRLAELGYTGTIESFTLYDRFMPLASQSVSNIIYVVITFALLPALTEEFVFRSIIITEYEEGGYGGLCAALMSALLFALLHSSISQFPVYLLGGIIFSAVVIVTRSVFAAMAVHFLNNIYQLFLEPFIFSLIKHPQNMVFLIFTCVVLFLVCLALMLGQIEKIYYIYGVTNRETPAWVKNRTKTPARAIIEALVSPTFLLCVLVFVIVTLGIAENL